MNREVSPLELSERVLGTSFFYDEQRTQVAHTDPTQLDGGQIGERTLVYTSVLRQLAGLRRQERQSSDDPFDNAAWQPTPDEMHSLSSTFESYAKRLKLVNNLERYIERYKTGYTDTGLRPHQQDAFDNLLAFTRAPSSDEAGGLTKSGFMDLPTAYGKTFIMTELVKAYIASVSMVHFMIDITPPN